MCNDVKLVGIVVNKPDFQVSEKSNRYLSVVLSVSRLSGTQDFIPVRIPSALMNNFKIFKGQRIMIFGAVCSEPAREGSYTRTEAYVLCKRFEFVPDQEPDVNIVKMCGYIVGEPTLRRTARGMTIGDFCVSIRKEDKKDKVYCIAWREVAMKLELLERNKKVEAVGRLQSRKYCKTVEDKNVEVSVLEVSADKVENVVYIDQDK